MLTNLSEDVTCQVFVHQWMGFDKLKKIHAATKLLHDQLIVLLIFKHVQDPEVNLDGYESLVFKRQKLFWGII